MGDQSIDNYSAEGCAVVRALVWIAQLPVGFQLSCMLTTWLQGFETALIYFPFRTLSFSLSTKIFTKKENFRRNYAELIMCTAHILVLVAVVRMWCVCGGGGTCDVHDLATDSDYGATTHNI